MAIVTTVSSSEFWQWLSTSSSYKDNFSYDGANAVQAYLEELSDEIDENIEFDPIAWCCDYRELTTDEIPQFLQDNNLTSVDEIDELTTVISYDPLVIAEF